MSARQRVGTASWTDPSLIQCGKFYPKGCSSPEARLRYYAEQFPLVEVDSSYYALPSARNSEAWVQRTPDDFAFNVKAFRLFTGHQTPAAALPKDVQQALASHFAGKGNLYYKDTPVEIRDTLWERFERGIRPLREAGKLRAVHFQFAPWVRNTPPAKDHILECATRLAGYHLALEFREQSWFAANARDETLDFERRHEFTHVIVDEPQGFANSIPSVWEVTSPKLAILRLHGRNAATWNRKGEAASERFNHDYADDELSGLAQRFFALAPQVLEAHAIFNNNYEDQGQRNGRTLATLLQRLEAGASWTRRA
jgi:uncharacterized protein YecE (DUF72 family)